MKKEDVKFVGFRLQNGEFLPREKFADLEGGVRLAIQHVVYTLCDVYILHTDGGIVYLEDNTGECDVFVCENIHTECKDPILILVGENGRYGIPLRALSIKDDTTLYVDWKTLTELNNCIGIDIEKV